MPRSKASIDATRRYESKNNDVVRLLLPKGTKERIRATGATVNGFISGATLDRLDGKPPTATGNTLTIDPPPDMKYNERIQILIDAGITSSVSDYILSVIGDNLDRELSYNGVSLWRYEHGTTEPRHK